MTTGRMRRVDEAIRQVAQLVADVERPPTPPVTADAVASPATV